MPTESAHAALLSRRLRGRTSARRPRLNSATLLTLSHISLRPLSLPSFSSASFALSAFFIHHFPPNHPPSFSPPEDEADEEAPMENSGDETSTRSISASDFEAHVCAASRLAVVGFNERVDERLDII